MKTIVSSTILFAVVFGMTENTIAQVVPDSTLGTQVTQTGLVFGINNGTRSGNNLFHSFSQFSIPTGRSAIFNNATGIQNIFSRITGSQISNIDGILRAQGTANLFLMNPNGIIFGPNAQLQLGGSFLGTTASSIQFKDGLQFGLGTNAPLLTLSVPVGLQMGTQPGSIQVNGNGHRLASSSSTTSAYLSSGTITGLKVQPGKTLALVGGPINLTGGALTAERGRIELASLGSSEKVALEFGPSLWKLNTDNTQKFNDITMARQSIVDVSGSGAGSIQVQGRKVSLKNASMIFVQNRSSTTTAGDVQVKADSLDISDTIVSRNIRSAIVNEARSGNSGNISVTTRQLNLMDGGSLLSRSFGTGSSGKIKVDASESIKIAGFPAENLELVSMIASISFSPLVTGRAGNIAISTPDLSLEKGGIITASTFGSAGGGNVDIIADRIYVSGRSVEASGSSAISSANFGQGNAGDLTIKTRSLLVKNQGSINTASYNNGNAGSIMINASEWVDLEGRSSINSGVSASTRTLIALLGLPTQPRGNAGNVVVNSPIVQVKSQSRIAVDNRTLGNSGKVQITADQILLDQNARITAATALGEGGNAILKSQSLILRRGSSVTATAGGTGNGGNITIESPIIIGLENSDIVANASKGRGGNIHIQTNGVFGLAYRPKLTPNNDITASSEFGINGNVEVNMIGINPANALNALPSEVNDSSRQIADRCGNAKGGSLVATGRGGIPQGPKKHGSDRTWNDLRTNALQASTIVTPLTESVLKTIAQNTNQPIVEATAIEFDEFGGIALTTPKNSAIQSAACGMAGSIGVS
jgi:filamentous hemagglutinin family protein